MSRSILAVTALALVSSSTLAQTIVRGPIFNPTTGARYYAVQAATWSAANSFAISMGCSMATVNDAAENTWIVSNFAAALGNPKLFIGLNDSVTEGTLAWTSGTSAYTNWAPGQPVNDANRDYTVVSPSNGQWTVENSSYTDFAIIKTGGALRVPQEYSTLAAAFAALPNSGTSTIFVVPGTYAVDSTITVASGVLVQPSAPGSVTFLAPTSGPAFTVNSGLTLRNVVLQGRANQPLVALNANAAVAGYDLHFRPISGSIAAQVQLASNTDFRMDSGSFVGGGPVLQCAVGGHALLRSVLIDSAQAFSTGSGATVEVFGSTITRCGPGPIFAAGNTQVIKGSIIWGNTGSIDPTRFQSGFTNHQSPIVGFGNMSADPQFVNPSAGDFRLSPGSPCIDRGTIQTVTAWIPIAVGSFVDSALESRLHDDRSTADGAEGFPPCDMGAFEFQGSSCGADFNLDGSVDFFDYLDFVDAFSVGC